MADDEPAAKRAKNESDEDPEESEDPLDDEDDEEFDQQPPADKPVRQEGAAEEGSPASKRPRSDTVTSLAEVGTVAGTSAPSGAGRKRKIVGYMEPLRG